MMMNNKKLFLTSIFAVIIIFLGLIGCKHLGNGETTHSPTIPETQINATPSPGEIPTITFIVPSPTLTIITPTITPRPPTDTPSKTKGPTATPENDLNLIEINSWQFVDIFDIAWAPNSVEFAIHFQQDDMSVGIRSFSVVQSEPLWTVLLPHSQTFAFSPDGKTIAATFYGGDILRFYESKSGQLLEEIDGKYKCSSKDVLVFSPDGETLYSGYSYGRGIQKTVIHHWDLVNKKCLGKFIWFDEGLLISLEVSPKGDILAGALTKLPPDYNRNVFLWDVSDKDQICVIQGERATFNPSGDIIAVANIEDQTIQLWSTLSCQIQKTINGPIETTRPIWPEIDFSPDGRFLVSGGEAIYIWDTHTGKIVVELGGFDFPNKVNFVSFSPDGKHLISVSGSIGPNTKDTLTLWEVDVRQ